LGVWDCLQSPSSNVDCRMVSHYAFGVRGGGGKRRGGPGAFTKFICLGKKRGMGVGMLDYR